MQSEFKYIYSIARGELNLEATRTRRRRTHSWFAPSLGSLRAHQTTASLVVYSSMLRPIHLRSPRPHLPDTHTRLSVNLTQRKRIELNGSMEEVGARRWGAPVGPENLMRKECHKRMRVSCRMVGWWYVLWGLGECVVGWSVGWLLKWVAAENWLVVARLHQRKVSLAAS
jgi:hypothetical protein